jgi:hypothetical protein
MQIRADAGGGFVPSEETLELLVADGCRRQKTIVCTTEQQSSSQTTAPLGRLTIGPNTGL